MTNKEKAKELLTTVRMMINSQEYGTDIIKICTEAQKAINFADLCYPYEDEEKEKTPVASMTDIALYKYFVNKRTIRRKDIISFLSDKVRLGELAFSSPGSIQTYMKEAKEKCLILNPSRGKYRINKDFKI